MITKTQQQEWLLFYDIPHLQTEVENITATIASRPYGKEGEMRPYITMNTDHTALFERLAKDALAEVRTFSYRRLIPEHHARDERSLTRLHIHLKVDVPLDEPCNCGNTQCYEGMVGTDAEEHYVPAKVRTVDDNLNMWLIWRIVFGWLELKAPEDAEFAAAKCAGYKQALIEIMRNPGMTLRPIRYW